MKREIIQDIIDWDIENWSQAIRFWEKNISIKDKKSQCLEVGASKGGLSLWLALNKNEVLCSDVTSPEKQAYAIHKKYDCNSNIKYASIDGTNIPYENHFDIIAFKSILGGISENNRNENKIKALDQMHKALKPGGKLLFAENMEASFMHKELRRRYGTKDWNYLRMDEISYVFKSFKNVQFTTLGYLGCLGRNETQRNILGKIDRVIEKIIPQKSRYIIVGIATK